MAVSVFDLWLAILLAGVLCWVASALIHMLIKYHNADYKPLPNEQALSEAMRSESIPPALYTMPYCSDMQEMGDEKMQQKFNTGPVAMIAVMPNGMPPMGKLLTQQILFFLFGALLIGYLASISILAESSGLTVFRQVFLTSFLAYGWAQIPHSIWLGQPWSNCLRYLIDALIYSSVTALVFVILWP